MGTSNIESNNNTNVKKTLLGINDVENLSSIFKGAIGNKLARQLMHLFGINKINAAYESACDYTGAAFATELLKNIGVQYQIGNVERLKELPEGAFITISNHPYGGIDGIMLIDLIASMRSDYKIMVNKILSLIKTMEENFISVTPTTNKKAEAITNLNGIRETLELLKNGHPVGFFPSGAVSDFRIKDFRIKDREWQEGIIRLIKIAKVPIVPIRFFDRNSTLFYFLGVIDWRIRSIRMPHEIFNKQNQKPRIGIGSIISVEEQKQFTDSKSFGDFLRKSVYEMPEPVFYTSRNALNINSNLDLDKKNKR